MQEPLPTLRLGHTLENRYVVRKKLGVGGYGAVYLAEDRRLRGRQVAVKELSDPSPEARALFRQEAAVLSMLNHKGLVAVSDYFEEGRSSYLVMDYIEGRDLLDLALESGKAQRTLPVAQVLDWMFQVCAAVTYLHDQSPPIVHRDIKPSNIRLSNSGRAILVDFGIAKIDPKAKTQMMAKAVSQGFSPPEQYGGGGSTDTRSDIYALGATIYCMLTLALPADGFERLVKDVELKPPREYNKEISPPVEQVILKAMSLNSLHRYRDAGEMLVALQRADGRPVRRPAKPKPIPRVDVPPKGKVQVDSQRRACPRCGAICLMTSRFCPRCGTPLSGKAGVACPQCGALNRSEARFCAKCRTPLQGARSRVQTGPALRTPAPAVNPRFYLAQGDQAMQGGRLTDATSYYEKARRAGMRSAELYVKLGLCYLQSSRAGDAVDLLEEGVGHFPRNADIHAQLALAYLGADKLSQGLQTLELAHRLNPTNLAVMEVLSQLYFDVGKHAKAVPLLEQLHRAAPDNPTYAARLAMAYFHSDRLDEAERLVRELERRVAGSAEAHFLKGMINLKRGKMRPALHAFRAAVQLDPDHALAHYFIGEVYFGQSRWNEAVTAYQQSALANPKDPDPHIKLCLCYLSLGEVNRAIAALERALQIAPNHPVALEIAANLAK